MENTCKSVIADLFKIFDIMLEGVSVYRLIFNDKGEVIDGILEYINPATVKTMGINPEDAIGNSAIEIFGLDFIQPHLKAIHELHSTGKRYPFEVYYGPTDKYFIVSGFDMPGDLFAVLRVDITEHKQSEEQIRGLLKESQEFAEELESSNEELQATTEELQQQQNELKASEARFHSLYENSFDAILLTKPDGSILAANHAAQEMFGMTEEEIVKAGRGGLVVNDEKLRQAIKEREQKGKFLSELTHKRKDGSTFLGEVTSSNFTDIDGIAKTSMIIRDITERKRAEEAIKESEKKYKHIVQFAPTGIYELDYKTPKFKSVNDSMAQILGYTKEELMNVNPFDLLSDESKPIFHERIQKVLNNEKIDESVDFKVRTKDGMELWVVLNIMLAYKDGKADSALVVAHDITERKQMEEELKQARDYLEEQVEERTVELKDTIKELELSNQELQSFAYITSHDLQEPLRTMASYAQLLERRYKGKLDPDADEFIEFMVSGATRMKGMIQGLLDYSRVGTRGEEFKEFNVNEALNHALLNLRSSIEENKSEITYGELPDIVADENQISRVFQNLIGNAIKFRKPNEHPIIHISAKKTDNEYVFSISDNSIGIERDYIDQIFEVFKRLHTIDEYQGAGIGLAIVKRIIDRHGGHVWVESEFGEGSTFYFTIPINKMH